MPDDPENDMSMAKHCSQALYSVVKSSMHAIHSEDNKAKQNAAHWLIQSAKT